MFQRSNNRRRRFGESNSFSRNNQGFRGRSRFRSNSSGKRGPKREKIEIHRFIKKAKPVEAEVYTPKHSFADFATDNLLKENIALKGITVPSPIQDQAIPEALQGKDIIGIANTGTGKTLAFALPILQKLFVDPSSMAIILAPTRELAQQIETECRTLTQKSPIKMALLIGGRSMWAQNKSLYRKPTLVIGTPGRIKDHIKRGNLSPEKFNLVVLDEVDRMLDMGFLPDVKSILTSLSSDRQSLFFSATMDNKVTALVQSFTKNPTTISIKTGETSDNVEQDVIMFSRHDKLDHLHNVLTENHGLKALVFDETKRDVDALSQELISRGFKADCIHGGKSQGQRQKALDKFKRSDVSVLVATDVAARGIDVADVTHVINYSLPQDYNSYVHRIGRAGRAGRTGYALTFVEER